jgi:predicted nucleic acid-binding protein
MLIAPFRVVLDANVLYPFTLRDTLLRAADAELYQAYWSDLILDEVERNLVENGVVTAEQATRLRAAMEGAFPEAHVVNFEPFIDAMRNDQKDRHVAAAAVRVGAQVIVTQNVRDFYDLPDGIDVQTADEFLANLFDLDPDTLVRIVEEQAAALRNPPKSVEDIIAALRKLAPDFAAEVEQHRLRSGGENEDD